MPHLFLKCDACGTEERVELPMSVDMIMQVAKKTRCTGCGKKWKKLRAPIGGEP